MLPWLLYSQADKSKAFFHFIANASLDFEIPDFVDAMRKIFEKQQVLLSKYSTSYRRNRPPELLIMEASGDANRTSVASHSTTIWH